jgi:hypothetical protein
LATSGVGRPSLGETGAAGAGMPPAAAFLRPSLLASRRNGEGPGGGVDGIAIPVMGRRVAAVGTEPADDEVGALRGSAPARSATFGWPATDSLDLPDFPNESDSLRVAWDTLARAVLGRVSAFLAGPAAGGATAASSGVTAAVAVGGTAAFAAGTSGPALAALGRTPGATLDWALYTWGGIGAAFGAGVDGISDTATGGTFGSAAGRALTCGPGGTWALGGGSLTSRTGDFLASPAGGAVATAFAAAAVGTSGLAAGRTFTSGAGRGR